MSAGSQQIPAFLADWPAERRVDLDVREDLRNGREPFSRIMAARTTLPEGGVLCLRATFEPTPLYAVMSKQGFDHFTEELASDDWRVWFHPRAGAAAADEAANPIGGASGAAAAQPAPPPAPDDPPLVVIDVRGMDPPEPMVRTLAALEELPRGKTLLQINERIPQFLLPRLDELGFTYKIVEQAEGVVRLFVRHRPPTAG